MPTNQQKKSEVFVWGILAGLSLLFFHQIILRTGFFFGDFANYDYPKVHFLCSQIMRGEWPTWCSYHDLGRPIGQMAWHSVFYPLYLLIAPFSKNAATFEYLFSLVYVFQVFWAALGTYYLLKYFKVSLQAAIIGAISVSFCSAMVITITSANNGAGFSWVPWIIYGLLRIYEEINSYQIKTFRKAIFTGAAVGCCFLIGVVQRDIPTAIFISAFGFLLVGKLVFEKRWLALSRFVVYSAIAGVIGMMISAVMLLPALEYYGLAGRTITDIYKDTNDQIPWRLFFTNIIPNIFGRVQGPLSNGTFLTNNFLVEWVQGPFNPQTWAIFWGGNQPLGEHWNFWCRVNYTGLLPMLALLFLPWLNWKRKNIFLAFFSIVSVFLLCYMYGINNPLQYAIAELIPIFKNFRIPLRQAFFLSFSLAIIMAMALDVIWPKQKIKVGLNFWAFFVLSFMLIAVIGYMGLAYMPAASTLKSLPYEVRALIDLIPKHAIYFQLGLLVLVCGLYILSARQKIKVKTSKWVLVALVFIDLFMFAGHINNATNAAADQYQEVPFIENLQELQSQSEGFGRFRFESNIAQANLKSMIWKLDSYNGYIMARTKHELELAKLRGINRELFYDLWNIKYSIFPVSSNQELQKNIKSIPKWAIPYARQGLVIKERATAMPRAWFVNKAVVKADQEALELISSQAFDPRKIVVLAQLDGQNGMAASNSFVANVEITSYQQTAIKLTVENSTPGYLVLSELYYPGWQATCDGKATTIVRANLAQRALPLAAGKHTIEISYTPTLFKMGFIFYALAFAIVGLAIISKLRKND